MVDLIIRHSCLLYADFVYKLSYFKKVDRPMEYVLLISSSLIQRQNNPAIHKHIKHIIKTTAVGLIIIISQALLYKRHYVNMII